jgi:hypothetical protein
MQHGTLQQPVHSTQCVRTPPLLPIAIASKPNSTEPTALDEPRPSHQRELIPYIAQWQPPRNKDRERVLSSIRKHEAEAISLASEIQAAESHFDNLSNDLQGTLDALTTARNDPNPESMMHLLDLGRRFDSILEGLKHSRAVFLPLYTGRHALQTLLLSERAFVAPWRRTPAELLGEIFSYCSSDDSIQSVTISHVCRYWRAIVLDTPNAWCQITISLSRKEPFGLALRCLAHSGVCPLSLTLIFHRYLSECIHDDLFYPTFKKLFLFDIFPRLLPRCRSLSFNCSDGTMAELLLLHMTLPTPLLEEMELYTGNTHRFQTATGRYLLPGTFEPILPRTPSLRTIKSMHMKDIWSMQMSRFIVDISVTDVAAFLADILTFLSSTTSTLQSLQIVAAVLSQILAVPSQEETPLLITLPNLHRLVLSGYNTSALLQSLTAPSLTHLSVTDSPDDHIPAGTVLRDLILRSSPPVRCLTLDVISMSDEEYITSFQHLPQLEELHIHNSYMSDVVIQQLGNPSAYGDDWICPRLTVFTLDDCECSGPALINLLFLRNYSQMEDGEARTWKIRRLEVEKCKNVSSVHLKSLNEILDGTPEVATLMKYLAELVPSRSSVGLMVQ